MDIFGKGTGVIIKILVTRTEEMPQPLKAQIHV